MAGTVTMHRSATFANAICDARLMIGRANVFREFKTSLSRGCRKAPAAQRDISRTRSSVREACRKLGNFSPREIENLEKIPRLEFHRLGAWLRDQ